MGSRVVFAEQKLGYKSSMRQRMEIKFFHDNKRDEVIETYTDQNISIERPFHSQDCTSM